MDTYLISGQEISFSCPFSDLESLPAYPADDSLEIPPAGTPLCRATGWIANDIREVEIYSAGSGYLLRVPPFRAFYIAPRGSAILPAEGSPELTPLEREVALGPCLVFALALGGKWCLHASAASYQDQTVAFLGESGEGKSTLASYLIQSSGWQRVADDILPVTWDSDGLTGWPYFPQLKLSAGEQPWHRLPERVPVKRVYLLNPVQAGQIPALTRLTVVDGIQALLSHTAGARMFDKGLLAEHLRFCAHAAQAVPVYRLSYPHSLDILPLVKDLLEQ